MDVTDEELHFLILRYLESGPCQEAARVLKEEIKNHRLLPKRIDWEGQNYPRAYEELVSTHPHIGPDHLKRICSRLPRLLDERFPPRVRGVQSLLGAGSQSMLRSEKNAAINLRPTSYLKSQNNGLLPFPTNLAHPVNILRNIRGTEYTGCRRSAYEQPKEIYSNYRLQRRFLGHLSAVYCVLYDRTGEYIFTGADDKLVKIWSAITGRLMATLRGHAGEIVDLSVNYENTLLASGSCDKTVRIWNLKTAVCLFVLHGHSATVTSLQFCPLARGNRRYLVSTGEDATVCFWHYDKNTRVFDSKPIKFIERSRAGSKMLCTSFSPGGLFLVTGNTDSVIRVYCLLGPSPEKIGELEAHSDMVDSIQYSHHSDRFVSGSKDGTARIWRKIRNEWLNLVLVMKAEISESHVSGVGPTASPLKVNMVAWTVDDKHVVTSVSDFTVRIWCSYTGKQVQTLKGHEDDVFVLECSMFNKNLLVTAGHDGRIKLWDIPSGKTLLDYYNMIDGQGFGAAYDGKWSPLHHSFSATDSHGHLMIFGVGENSLITEDKIPTELFFHTDYRALIRDANDHVLDELTQRAVHLLPPPFLVNIEAVPYPPKFQRLVPGREKLPEQYLIPVLAETTEGEREVTDQEIPADIHLNTSVNRSQTQQSQSDASQPSTSQSAPVQASASQPTTSQNDSNQSLPQTSTSDSQAADDNTTVADPILRTVIPEMSAERVMSLDQQRLIVTEAEHEYFKSEAQKRPFREGDISTDFSAELGYSRTRRRNNQNYSTRSARRQQERREGEQAVRNRLTTRALYDTDVETDEEEQQDFSPSTQTGTSSSSDDEEVGGGTRRSRAARRNRESRTQSDGGSYEESTDDGGDGEGSSSDYSDWEPDNRANLQPPSRRSGRKVVPPRIHSPDDDDDDEPSTSRSERNQSRAKAKSDRAARAKKRAKRIAAQFESSIAAEASSEVDMLDAVRPPEWLTTDMPRKSPYFPQMGDEVIYFFQGHQMYLEEVTKQNLYDSGRGQPWEKIPNLREQELVRVMGIKYEVKPPSFVRLCCVKLGRIYPDSKKYTGTHFNVKYHDMPGIVDFLVLRQHFDISQQRNWQVGDKFRSIIDDKWWSGEVVSLQPYNMHYSDSQFLCLKVLWDDRSEDTMSPWDLEPLPDNLDGACLRGGDITEEEMASLLYNPDEQEWPDHGREEECSRIASCLEQLMEYSVTELFNAPVDLNQFQNYALEVPYPIDLSTIKSRLEHSFYRRVAAIQFDVRHIESNAELFNRPGSRIVSNARIVTELCLNVISDPACRDARAVYTRLDLDDDYYATIDIVSPKKKTAQPKVEVFNWQSAALNVIDEITENDDSEPFRAPVDTFSLQDYLDVVDTPMDLTTLKENLEGGEYETLQQFIADLRLIFSNSRKYNTNARSKIYSMTIRLNAMAEDRIHALQEKQKKAKKIEAANSSSSASAGRSRYSTRARTSQSNDPLILIVSKKPRGYSQLRNGIDNDPSASTSTPARPGLRSAVVSMGASNTGIYATRSSTGRLKPKQFGEDILVDRGGLVTHKSRKRYLPSSDEDPELSESEEKSSPLRILRVNAKKRRTIAESESDYDKETDDNEGETDVEVTNGHHSNQTGNNSANNDTETELEEEENSEDDISNAETEDDESFHAPTASRSSRSNGTKNYDQMEPNRTHSRTQNKQNSNQTAASHNTTQRHRANTASNQNERPTRSTRNKRTYKEQDSDTDISSDEYQALTSTTVSSRGRVRKLRTFQ